MPVKPGSASGGDLRDGASPDIDLQREAISREDSSRHIMQMHERPAVGLLKSPDHLPRRFLGIHAHPCALVCSFETKLKAGA